jgi:hypothetical protein
MGEVSGTYGENRGACRALVGKSEGKSPLGRPRRRWEDKVDEYVKEIVQGGVKWIYVAQIWTGGGLL